MEWKRCSGVLNIILAWIIELKRERRVSLAVVRRKRAAQVAEQRLLASKCATECTAECDLIALSVSSESRASLRIRKRRNSRRGRYPGWDTWTQLFPRVYPKINDRK